MFSYVDSTIGAALERDGKLVHLDREGRRVRREDRPYLSLLGPIPIPRRFGDEQRVLDWYPFVRHVELDEVLGAAARVPAGGAEALRALLTANMSVNSLLACPRFPKTPSPLVRIHSCCMTGDVFGSLRCECGPQLETAFERIFEEGDGAVIYMSGHEGRGIGLWAKAVTYVLQDAGQDTYQANVSLGLPEDSRDFTDAAVVLRHLLCGRSIRLMSNNPLKRRHLEQAGQPVESFAPHVAGLSEHNLRYLRAKRGRGHLLPEEL